MKNKTRVIHKTLSFILIILMLFIPVLSTVSAETIETEAINADDKLTENLKAHLETIEDDEYVPVYVWLEDYGEDMFYQVLSKRLGVSITEQNEEAYIGSKVAEKVQLFEENLELMKANASEYGLQTTEAGEIDIKSFSPMLFRAKASISDTMTDTEIQNCLNSGMTSTEIINLSERHQYLKDYRQTRKLVNTTANQEFSRLLDLTKCRNVYLSEGLTFLSLECKKSYIDTISNNSMVETVDLVVDVEFVTPEVEETPDASTYGFWGNSYYMNDQYSFDGSGIKIGVLEAGDIKQDVLTEETLTLIRFDDEDPYLTERNIITNTFTEETKNDVLINRHATDVLKIVGGRVVETSAEKYSGIAPCSSLYFTSALAYSETSEFLRFERALEWLVIENGVDIVNMSFGFLIPTGIYFYGETDKIVDLYATEYRVLFVVASGNSTPREESEEVVIEANPSNVLSPALSYNAISVGNAQPAKINSTFAMMGGSCYTEQSHLTNKPDISAFGTGIIMINPDGSGQTIEPGTSFSAPMVAGAAALVMQANTYLTVRPDAVKAILLGTADETAISIESTTDENGNTVINNDIISTATSSILDTTKYQSLGSNLREKSGAGLLNIEAAIRMAQKDMYYPVTISNEDFVGNEFLIFQGTTLEFGVVYEKSINSVLTSAYPVNLNIQLLDSSGNIVFKSTDTINNVEIFKGTVLSTGYYRFKIEANVPEGVNPGNFKATMFVFCGCSEKTITQGACNFGGHELTCSAENCGFDVIESHTTIDLPQKTLSNGIKASGLVSCLLYSDLEYFEYDCFDVYIWPSSSSGDMTVTLLETPWDYSISYVNGGEERKITYAILVTQNGTTTQMLLPEITVYTSFSDGSITASW